MQKSSKSPALVVTARGPGGLRKPAKTVRFDPIVCVDLLPVC